MIHRPEQLCTNQNRHHNRQIISRRLCIDNSAKLRRFISERSKILPRRTTGTCAMHQRQLTEAIKRARQIALLPFVTE